MAAGSFPDATAREKSGRGLYWTDEIREGGVFVLFPPDRRQIPLASEAFLSAMEKSHVVSHQITIPQRDGSAYALSCRRNAPVDHKFESKLPASP